VVCGEADESGRPRSRRAGRRGETGDLLKDWESGVEAEEQARGAENRGCKGKLLWRSWRTGCSNSGAVSGPGWQRRGGRQENGARSGVRTASGRDELRRGDDATDALGSSAMLMQSRGQRGEWRCCDDAVLMAWRGPSGAGRDGGADWLGRPFRLGPIKKGRHLSRCLPLPRCARAVAARRHRPRGGLLHRRVLSYTMRFKA
jgi:hypothetical protein